MGCFIVPTIVSIITTAFRKNFPKNWHISWLNTMLIGGSIGLTVEHIAHQEIVPWFPFLSAMSSHTDAIIMLKEMAGIGIPMTLALIFVWLVMVIIYERFIIEENLPSAAKPVPFVIESNIIESNIIESNKK
jgi:hypothetical protein